MRLSSRTILRLSGRSSSTMSKTFDPGPDGTYPWFPRLPDGSPAWKDRCPPGYPLSSVPRGTTKQRAPGGRVFLIDLTPYGADGKSIDPPTVPSEVLRKTREKYEGTS